MTKKVNKTYPVSYWLAIGQRVLSFSIRVPSSLLEKDERLILGHICIYSWKRHALCYAVLGYTRNHGEHPHGEHNSPEAPHFNKWIALEFIAAVGTNLDAVFPLVGPSLNLTTCHVCFQLHFSPDQCHLSFFLKLKTHICLKEVQVSFETSFYSYFMRMWNNQQWKTKKPPFISFNLFGSISITNTFFSVLLFLLVVFLFFWGGEGVWYIFINH